MSQMPTRAGRTQLFYAPGGPANVTPAGSLKTGLESLGAGETSKAVVFPAVFGATPVIIAFLIAPNGGYVISCTVDDSTITTSGFTAQFAAAMPDANYKLAWFASLPS